MRNKFPKGNKLGGRPKGALNKTTILKEERRAIFDEQVSAMFLDTIAKARPEYLLDQFLGKTADKLEHTIEMTEPSEKIKQLAERLRSTP